MEIPGFTVWNGLPDGEILGAVQIVHGMMEHTGRYRETAEWLADRGIAVYGHDHLGHGRTAAEKEDLGYFGDRDGELSLVKDVRRLTLYGKGDTEESGCSFWATAWAHLW